MLLKVMMHALYALLVIIALCLRNSHVNALLGTIRIQQVRKTVKNAPLANTLIMLHLPAQL